MAWAFLLLHGLRTRNHLAHLESLSIARYQPLGPPHRQGIRQASPSGQRKRRRRPHGPQTPPAGLNSTDGGTTEQQPRSAATPRLCHQPHIGSHILDHFMEAVYHCAHGGLFHIHRLPWQGRSVHVLEQRREQGVLGKLLRLFLHVFYLDTIQPPAFSWTGS